MCDTFFSYSRSIFLYEKNNEFCSCYANVCGGGGCFFFLVTSVLVCVCAKMFLAHAWNPDIYYERTY